MAASDLRLCADINTFRAWGRMCDTVCPDWPERAGRPTNPFQWVVDRRWRDDRNQRSLSCVSRHDRILEVGVGTGRCVCVCDGKHVFIVSDLIEVRQYLLHFRITGFGRAPEDVLHSRCKRWTRIFLTNCFICSRLHLVLLAIMKLNRSWILEHKNLHHL